MADLMGVLAGLAPVVAVLVWCNLRDRRIARAEGVRATVNATLNEMLGGESLVAVQVEPARGSRLGRVHLLAPNSYESLLAQVSGAVLAIIPGNYELVVHPAHA